MRAVQYRILTLILEHVKVPDYVYAFEKEKSIPKMATLHVGKKVVVSVDIKDYFTSIKQRHVENLFIELGITGKAARTLSELCTYKAFVPQGALTSPKVSNLITAMTFGPAIKAYCDSKGYVMSVYADDITISTDRIDGTDGSGSLHELLETISNEMKRHGFVLNGRKTKIMKFNQRQYVCGAVVNQKVNLQKSERHKLRAIVHNCSKHGLEREASKNGMEASKFAEVIMGKLNWFNQLNPVVGGRVISKFKEAIVELGQPSAKIEDVKVMVTSGDQTKPNLLTAVM